MGFQGSFDLALDKHEHFLFDTEFFGITSMAFLRCEVWFGLVITLFPEP